MSMKQLYFVYVFMTFSIGMVSLGIATITYVRTKDKLVQYYLYFHSAFTLLVVSKMFLLYLHTTVSPTLPYITDTLEYVANFIASFLLMITLPVFIHYLLSVPHAKRKNVRLGMIIVIAHSARHFFEFVMHDEIIGDYLAITMFLAILLYSLLSGLYYYKRLQHAVKNIVMKSVILSGISLPVIIHDIFYPRTLPFSPMIYCGFSIIFIHHFMKYYFHQPQVLADTLPDASAQMRFHHEELFNQYHVSPREKEVITLLLQGYSNNQIGETLYVSLSTVKTHLRNIYPKFGVNNRYELISFFKNPKEEPLPPS